MTAQPSANEPHPAEQESPLEHVVQHPLIERPAHLGPLTPNGTITVFSDQIAMIALAGLLLVALIPMVVKRRRGRSGVDAMVPAGAANGLEADLRVPAQGSGGAGAPASTPIASSSTSGACFSSC